MGILQDQQIGLAAWVCLGFEKLEFRLQLCSPARCNNGRRYVGDGRRRRLADIGASEVAQKCKGGHPTGVLPPRADLERARLLLLPRTGYDTQHGHPAFDLPAHGAVNRGQDATGIEQLAHVVLLGRFPQLGR